MVVKLFDVGTVILLCAFDVPQFSSQIFVSRKVFAQMNEGPDDYDVQCYCALARQN